MSVLTMYPLQSALTDFRLPQPTAGDLLLFAGGIGVLALILIVLNILKNRIRLPNEKLGTAKPRRFSVFALNRLAGNLGLDHEQTKMLDFALRNDGVSDPALSLNSASLLDRHFKRAFRTIELTSISEDELNNRLSVLFATRNIIETNNGAIAWKSTRQIPENTAAVLAVGNTNYPVRVIHSHGDSLVIENPMSSTGSLLSIPRGSKVSLSFFTQSSKGFVVESRVLDPVDAANGPALQLVHSGQIKKLSNRRFRRRQTVISTALYLVHIEGTGREKDKKMAVDKKKFSGDIMDISIGGCSIKTSVPVNTGQRLKIEFTREDNSIVAALGEVLRTNLTEESTILNIRFLKVPRKSLNSINAMVYKYEKQPKQFF